MNIDSKSFTLSKKFNPFTPEVDIYARSSDWYCAKANQYGINGFTDLASKNLGLSIAALILRK